MITARKAISTNYVLDIPAEKLSAIMFKDNEVPSPLYLLLTDIDGVFNVDYDGHFGPHICMTLDIESESEDVWKVIYEIIENYL